MNETDSKTIEAVRFPLAIMVVAIHSYFAIDGWSYANIVSQGVGSNVAQFFMIAIAHVLAHIAVPTFFLISGFLFFQNFGDGGLDVWKRKFKSRLKTLVIPYILWIVLFVLWSLVLNFKNVQQYGVLGWLQSIGGIKMFWCSNSWNLDRVDLWGNTLISSSPILVPFWFIRNLIVCVFLLSPLLYLIFSKVASKCIHVAVIIILTTLYLTQTSLLIPGLSSHTIFYYGIGAAISLFNRSLTEEFSKHKYLIWGMFISLLVVEVALNGHNTIMGNILYPFFVLIGVVSLFNLKIGSWGGYFTFFIFAFHIFILPFVKVMVLKILCLATGVFFVNNVYFADKYPHLVIIEYFLIVAIDVVVCMITYSLLHKIAPKLCKVLCGR